MTNPMQDLFKMAFLVEKAKYIYNEEPSIDSDGSPCGDLVLSDGTKVGRYGRKTTSNYILNLDGEKEYLYK